MPAKVDTASIWHLSAKSSAVLVHNSLTAGDPQENHAGQQFWPNLFQGRWLKGFSR
jgi:hypothetical protein